MEKILLRASWILATGLMFAVAFMAVWGLIFYGKELAAGPDLFLSRYLRIFLPLIFFIALVLLITQFSNTHKFDRLEHQQSWLIDAVNSNVKTLKSHSDYKPREGDEDIERREMSSRWPWGTHHTEYLGHLEAAARKWWVLYDPGDATTAPTNDIVSDWLQSERKLSREKARAIASMLRPDGLPTGPRK